jgi:tetratricopeptide (TPR) repeat protein
LTGLGTLAFTQNDYPQAEKLYHQAIEIGKEMESLERVTSASVFLGTAQLYSGQFKQATRVLETCVAYTADLGLPAYKVNAYYYLGFAQLHLGKYGQAGKNGEMALRLAQKTFDDEFISQSITIPGAVALARGLYVDALERFEMAAKVQGARRVLKVFGEDCGQLGLAAALLQLGRLDESQALLKTHLQQAVATYRQERVLYALVGIALLKAKHADIELAIELYNLAASYPFVGNSQWFWDAFGQHIEGLTTSLPKGKAAEASVRSKQQDLWGTAEELLLDHWYP